MKKSILFVIIVLSTFAATSIQHVALCNESVEEFIEDEAYEQNESTTSIPVETSADLEDIEIAESFGPYSPADHDISFIERTPEVVEHIIRIENPSNKRDGETKFNSSDAKVTKEKSTARPELGSTASKTRKILYNHVPTLRKKKKDAALIPGAQNLTDKHIEPMIESHQALNQSENNNSKALLMNVSVEDK
ncbi:MAG: hypothetical protein F9K49_03640 [Caedimonadaceae bacterium]|nr:MAG: hypothetical protein F9K49_03640 [Caedimonadaceae bacterium]